MIKPATLIPGVHDRIHKCKNHQYLKLCLDQVIIRFAKACFFIDLTNAGFDDPDAGYVFLHDLIYLIQLGLQLCKQRVGFVQTEDQTAHNKGECTQDDQAKITIQAEHEQHTSEHQHGGTDHAADKL